MSHKLTFKTKDEVPESLREAAKEIDGAWTVTVVSSDKLSEFRDRNLAASKEVDTLKAEVSAIRAVIGDKMTPAELKARMEELTGVESQVKDGKLKGTSEIQTEVEKRTEAMRRAADERLAEQAARLRTADEQAGQYRAKYERSQIETHLMQALSDSTLGVSTTAIPDIIRRAHDVFKIDDKTQGITIIESDMIRRGEDGVTNMTAVEWVKELQRKAPHYFKASQGGGASGTGAEKIGNLTKDQVAKLSGPEKMRLANSMPRK